jgi:hypothetical protein
LPKSARAPTYLNYPRPSPEIAANAHNGSPLMLRYLMYTAAARWPGQLLGRSTTRRLAALIPIQRGRHGLQSISTAPLHSACPGRPSTNQPLGSNSSATLLATSRWWRVFESVNAETERPTQPHLGDHGGTRTPPRHGAQIIFVRRCSGHECVIHDYPAILVALAVEGPADLRPCLRGGGFRTLANYSSQPKPLHIQRCRLAMSRSTQRTAARDLGDGQPGPQPPTTSTPCSSTETWSLCRWPRPKSSPVAERVRPHSGGSFLAQFIASLTKASRRRQKSWQTPAAGSLR